ncbi:hypothetical protein SAMN05444168_4695 [Paraburkholderia phenazinium]|uniref:Uncharacterized protein n=1 Tax=Paraburkholderia phenazinium TaxID=60549 RepID=A0A1N6JMX6_9BURK|nr:hypothetical protein SAMN05444168_4695 [Paraburkholderia phenazinium]
MSNSVAAPMPVALYSDLPMTRQAYRAFRARLIASEAVQRRIEKAWAKTSYIHGCWARRPLGLAYGRHVIQAFRDQALDVLETLTDDAIDEATEDAACARRALRVPDNALPERTRGTRTGYGLLRALAPLAWWRRVAARLRPIGTPEGRRLVFAAYARPSWRDQPHFDEALDFFLRHFTLPDSAKGLIEVGWINETTVRNAWRLGLRSADALTSFADASRGFPAEKLAVLIELEVIRTVEELTWLEQWRSEREHISATPGVHRQAKRSIARLLELGAPRRSILRLLDFWNSCAPEDLNQSLSALAARGYGDGAQIFKALEQTLWLAPSARNWDFVIDVVGAREVHHIALFDEFLRCDTLPDAAVIRAVQVPGSKFEDLAQTQSFLLTLCDRRAQPARVIALLLAEPHALRIEQLAHCRSYAVHRSEDELQQFLATLAQHGFGTTVGVLAFEEVYKSWLQTSKVGRLLALYRRLRDAPPDPQAAAKWVIAVGEKYLDSLEYLTEAFQVTDRGAFQQIRPFARIAKNVLAWAIEGRGHATVEALRTWRRSARGIEQVDNYEWREPVTQILLEDAAARGDFIHVNRNWRAFWKARRNESEAIVGRPAVGADKMAFEVYWARVAELEPLLEERALPHLRHQLEATGGFVAASLIRAAWHDARAYEQGLATFTSEVKALLDGRGPNTADISELQADAISAVYGIDFEPQDTYWSKVVALETHLAGLTLRPYTMHFARQRIEIKGKRQIDSQGVVALREAFDYGRRFRQMIGIDVGLASEGLSPRQMRENQRAASPQTLHRHLGVLLGVLPESMTEALSIEIEAFGLETHDPERRHEAATHISNFFEVELGDTLPQGVGALKAQLGEFGAATLARRLVDATSQEPDSDGLVVAFERTANRVRELYGRWIHRQLDVFTGGAVAAGGDMYRAVVSKYGAAYYSKVATKLCSDDNERMWQERRQSHLLVFDLARKRLAAMAMLYVERVAAIDPVRPTLVMRAINTLVGEDSGHDPDSVVRAFFSVGEQIAKDNRFAAFAIPTNTGQHLLSNRNEIVAVIARRCNEEKADHSAPDGDSPQQLHQARVVRLPSDAPFYGYEHGRAPVHILYVLWSPSCETAVHSAGEVSRRPDATDTRTL